MKKYSMVFILCLSMLLIACTQTPERIEKEAFSGYLGTYSVLEEHEDDLGSFWRWVSPKLSEGLASGKYSSAYIDNVGYYPAPKSTDAVPSKALIEIAHYFTKVIRLAIGSEMTVLDEPAEATVRMQVAITGVSVDADTLKDYKYNPVSMMFSGDAVKVYIEVKVTDATTGELLGLAVREGFGDVRANKEKVLTLNGVRSLLDQWAANFKKTAHHMISASDE